MPSRPYRRDPESLKTAIPSSGYLLLEIDSRQGPELKIALDVSEGYVIGRSDDKSRYKPDVDLFAFDALNKGVSRRHAAIVRYQDVVHLIDLSSVNGTLLNGERLSPERPYPLHSGDIIVLGQMTIGLRHIER